MSAPTPLFLLNTVLMPGGVLPLRVFESRYLDMVARSMRENEPFAVVAISAGKEVGAAAQPSNMGTLARVADWDQGTDGLLHVVANGLQRARILDSWVQPDGLTVAEVDALPDDDVHPLPEEMVFLARGLEQLLDQLGAPYAGLQREPENAVWVGNRLTEVLPMNLESKQVLLETLDPMARIEAIEAWILSQREGLGEPS